MADSTFGFESDGCSEDEVETCEPTDGHSDIEESDSNSWSSDDESPLADMQPLAALNQEGKTGDTATAKLPVWTASLSPVTVEAFTATPGPTTVMTTEQSELDFFHLIFPATLFSWMSTQTNLYARQRQAVKADRLWTPTTPPEMCTFIGITMLMSLVELPSYKMYWTTDWLFKTSLPSIMTRIRFEKLMEYFHVNDSTTNPARGEEGHDKLHHIRPVMKTVQRTIKEQYTLHQNFAIDEAMIAFKGRLGFKQYMPAKPTKFGIKVWERADATNGYVDKFQVYVGRAGNNERRPEVGLASRVVLDLTRDITGSQRHCYMDNFFTSPYLFRTLLDDGIYACGTCRHNRKGFPTALHKGCVKNRGDFLIRQSGNLVATAWYDNKPVLFLSTNSCPTRLQEVHRKNKDGSDHVHLAPEVIKKYTANMNAVDRADQLRTQYSCARKSHKWWKYLFFFLLDTAVVNSFILMKESPNHTRKTKSGKTKPLTQLEFKQKLCHQLIGERRVIRKRKRVERPDDIGGNHWPQKMKGNRCRQCAKSQIRRESSYGCRQCSVNLCVTCFEPFHCKMVPATGEE